MRAYGVRDDENVGLGSVFGGGLGQIADDGSVGVEEVWQRQDLQLGQITSSSVPSRLIPGLRGTPAGIKTISLPLRASARPVGVGSYPRTCAASAFEALAVTIDATTYLALGVDVANVGGNTFVNISTRPLVVSGDPVRSYQVPDGCRRGRAG